AGYRGVSQARRWQPVHHTYPTPSEASVMREFLAARLGERSTATGIGLIVGSFFGLSGEQAAQVSEGIVTMTTALHQLSPLAPAVAGLIAALWPTSGGRAQQ
ncbi:MAG: hypothetical protein ACRC1H_05865, partial [Caldilineaceae bacterium]